MLAVRGPGVEGGNGRGVHGPFVACMHTAEVRDTAKRAQAGFLTDGWKGGVVSRVACLAEALCMVWYGMYGVGVG